MRALSSFVLVLLLGCGGANPSGLPNIVVDSDASPEQRVSPDAGGSVGDEVAPPIGGDGGTTPAIAPTPDATPVPEAAAPTPVMDAGTPEVVTPPPPSEAGPAPSPIVDGCPATTPRSYGRSSAIMVGNAGIYCYSYFILANETDQTPEICCATPCPLQTATDTTNAAFGRLRDAVCITWSGPTQLDICQGGPGAFQTRLSCSVKR